MALAERIRDQLVGQGVSRDLAALSLVMSIASFGGGMVIPLLAPLIAGLRDPFLPEYLFGLPVTTELQVGILFSVFGITRSILQVPMGRLSDRLGVRKLFLEVGLLVSATALYIYGQVGTASALISVRALQGFGLAASTPALMALVEGVTETRTRGGSMGFFSTMRTLGWGIGPIVGGLLTDAFGIQFTVGVGAALTVVAVIAIHFTVPEVKPGEGVGSEPEAGAEPEVGPDGQPVAANGAALPRGNVLWLFSSRRQATTLIGLSLALVTMMMGFSAMVAMENPILERIGDSKAGFGLVFAIATITRLFFQFPVGIASDTYGRKPFIVWGLMISAPLVGLMGFAHTLVEFTALRGIMGVALAGVVAPAYALAADVVDEHRSGEQMGVVTTAFSVGFAFGPILAGALAFKGFAVPFLVAAALTVIGAVLVWLMVDETEEFEAEGLLP